MTIFSECSLSDFEPWDGAVDCYYFLTDEQLEQLENALEETHPFGMSAADLNNLFWYEQDRVAEYLGFEDWEALERFNNVEDE